MVLLRHVLILFFAFGGAFSSLPAQTTPAWPPVSHEDLELKDNPLRPGEPAMILTGKYRRTVRSHWKHISPA